MLARLVYNAVMAIIIVLISAVATGCIPNKPHNTAKQLLSEPASMLRYDVAPEVAKIELPGA